MSETTGTSIVVSDVAHSQVIIGSRNFALQLTVDGGSGYSDRAASEPLQPRPLPVLNPRRAAEPIGREPLVEQAATALLAGHSVQLCGSPGVGKTAIAEAVARRLATDQRQGVVLAAGATREELSALYTDLAKLFFSVSWFTPDEAVLRAETARHRPSGVIVVPDCALSAEDADRLLGTFPDCTFLLCSRQQSLYSGQPVLDVVPLDLDGARALVERELGRPLEGLENVQVARIHELGEGRVARLLVCAAFLRRAALDARQHATVPLSPREQTAVLVEGIGEQARRALVALTGFGPAPAALFDALTGLEGTGESGAELEHAGLATRVGDVYTATEDARGAVAEHGWTADPQVAADGLRRAGTPDPRLSVEIAQALLRAGAADRVSAFARVAAPAALAAGDVHAWRTLVTLGLRTAREGGRSADLAYFLGEDHTAALVRGDRVAAAAAFAALGAELIHLSAHPTLPTAPHPISRPPAGQPGRQQAQRGVRTLRRGLSARYGGIAATALLTATAVTALAAVAGAAYGSDLLAGSSHHGSTATVSSAANSTGAPVEQFPYTVADQPYYKSSGGSNPYLFAAQYPVVSDLPNKAVEQKINAELRAPLDQDARSYAPTSANTLPGFSKPDPAFWQITAWVYQTGQLISAQYLGLQHFSGGGDVSYIVQTVTVRTDTGAALQNSDILTPAATGADLNTLINDLQAQPGISTCDESTGWQGLASLQQAMQPSAEQNLGSYLVNVTSTGLQFTFADDAISGTACRPVAVLPWSELTGLVNPEIQQLRSHAGATTGAAASGASAAAGNGSGSANGTATVPATNTATTATASATPSVAPTTPAAVIQAYYAAINAKDYQQAWKLGGNSLGESYNAFTQGFASTKNDSLIVNSVSGDTVYVTLTATQNDGSVSKFSGTYTVSGSAFTSAHLAPAG